MGAPTQADLHHNLRLSIAYEPAETIKPNPRDPRVYSAAETRRISKALKTFGSMPVIVNAERVVLSGNVWLEAAKLAGIGQLPIVVADHLTPAQAEAFMIAQVRLVETGSWDELMLGQILKDLTLQDLDFDLEIIGFDVPQIDLYIENLEGLSETPDPADDPGPAGPPISRLGDVWLLGAHKILCGDSLKPENYEILMARELAAVVFADPPYNVKIAGNVSGLGAAKHGEFAMASGEMTEVEFIAFLTTALSLAAKHSVDGSLAYWCMDWRHLHEMTVSGREAYGALQNLCVWVKTNGGMGSLYRSQHELVFVFKNGKGPHRNNIHLGKHGRNRTNTWSYPGANTFGRGGGEGDLLGMHPTVKPVAMIADVLFDVTARGDLLLDPFLGSGSSVIAAEKVGRRLRGIELDPTYVDTAIRRWQRWTGEEALLDGGLFTFEEIGAQRAKGLVDA